MVDIFKKRKEEEVIGPEYQALSLPEITYPTTPLEVVAVEDVPGSTNPDDNHSDLAVSRRLAKSLVDAQMPLTHLSNSLSRLGYKTQSYQMEAPLRPLIAEDIGEVRTYPAAIAAYQPVTRLADRKLLAGEETGSGDVLALQVTEPGVSAVIVFGARAIEPQDEDSLARIRQLLAA